MAVPERDSVREVRVVVAALILSLSNCQAWWLRTLLRMALAPFETATAVLGTAVALNFYLNPHSLNQSSVGHTLGLLANVWNAFYLVGGVTIMIGILRPSLAVEAFGVAVFGTAILFSGVATWYLRGTPSAVAFAVLFGYAFASAARFAMLLWVSPTIAELDAARRSGAGG
jgi:hypothetical protein